MTTPPPPSHGLLPCPWCDGHVETQHRKEPKGYWVHCDGCGCDGPIDFEEADAIKSWNTRTPTHPAEVTALTEHIWLNSPRMDVLGVEIIEFWKKEELRAAITAALAKCAEATKQLEETAAAGIAIGRESGRKDRDHLAAEVGRLRGLLGEALTCLKEAKRMWAPSTTNSDADVAIARITAALASTQGAVGGEVKP